MLSTAFFCVWCLNKNYWIITGVQPTDEEKEVWEKVQAVLNESQTILQDIQQYTGATEDIKQVSNRDRRRLLPHNDIFHPIVHPILPS